jgi:hypothetical protein
MKRRMSQQELDAELHSHFDGAPEPSPSSALGDVLRTLPDDPKEVRRSRGFSRLPAVFALTAVVLLAVAAIGLPLVMTGSGTQATPSPSPSSVADATETPVLEGPPSADATATATDVPVDPPSDMPSDMPLIDSTPGPTAAPGDNNPGWWSSIVIKYAAKVQSGADGWVEVTTKGPTQCELLVYYSADLQQNLGGFGAPSSKPRRDTYSVPPDFSGIARPKVTCWRDGPQSGPRHSWTLSVTVTKGPAPTPSWKLTTFSQDGSPGGFLVAGFRATTSIHCTGKITMPDGALINETGGHSDANVNDGFTVYLAADAKTGTAHYTITCQGSDGFSQTVSGTVKVVPAATPPPATDPPPTAPTTKPTAAPTTKPTAKPTVEPPTPGPTADGTPAP